MHGQDGFKWPADWCSDGSGEATIADKNNRSITRAVTPPPQTARVLNARAGVSPVQVSTRADLVRMASNTQLRSTDRSQSPIRALTPTPLTTRSLTPTPATRQVAADPVPQFLMQAQATPPATLRASLPSNATVAAYNRGSTPVRSLCLGGSHFATPAVPQPGQIAFGSLQRDLQLPGSLGSKDVSNANSYSSSARLEPGSLR